MHFGESGRGHLGPDADKMKKPRAFFGVFFFVSFISVPVLVRTILLSPCTKLTRASTTFDADMLWLICHVIVIDDQTCCINKYRPLIESANCCRFTP